MSFDLQTVKAFIAAHGKIARILVVKSAGSVPREVGTSMIVWKDGQAGTIGGGRLEWDAIARARAALNSDQNAISDIPLGPALGQCCGGHVSLVTEVLTGEALSHVTPSHGLFTRRITGNAVEPFGLQKAAAMARNAVAMGALRLENGWLQEPLATDIAPLWIWGAGHVGRALVDTIAPLPNLKITWLDTGLDRFPKDPPVQVAVLPAPDLGAAAQLAPSNVHHLIVTYSHAIDLELCHRLLGHGFASAGLIGSATKWARFRKRLAELGHTPTQIDTITCPIGQPHLGKHPQAIAIGVAAEVLKLAQARDVKRDVAI